MDKETIIDTFIPVHNVVNRIRFVCPDCRESVTFELYRWNLMQCACKKWKMEIKAIGTDKDNTKQ